jgi:uncharacterized protein
MQIGVLTVRLRIEGADSLKDKRQVVRSLVQRMRGKFNVSASEIEDLDVWRRATLGVAIVTNDARFTNQVLMQVINYIEHHLAADGRAVLDNYALEVMALDPGVEASPDEIDVSDWFATDDSPADSPAPQ